MSAGQPTPENDGEPATTGRRIKGLDRHQRLAQRRQKLLDAALTRFAADGYANAAIEQLCQDAGVSTRSYYQLFDGKEACYLALLRQITERVSTAVVETLRQAPADEDEAVRALLAAFVHGLADDRRVADVTFGQAGAISPAVDRQRRTNRRWAASFVEGVWRQYGVVPESEDRGGGDLDVHRMAVGLIGGMFDLIADFTHDGDSGRADGVDDLVDDISDFYRVVSDGLRSRASLRSGRSRSQRAGGESATRLADDP